VSDVVLNKMQIIRRCLQRIREEYADDPKNLQNYTKQDAIILNLQRACEASISLAMHLVSDHRWGLPQTSRDAFDFLHEYEVIDVKLANQMKNMVGFRNIAVHDYQRVDLGILQTILQDHLADFVAFVEEVRKWVQTK
jgi:uncharacterized protein YutE (UPF0331/DUF86 family)